MYNKVMNPTYKKIGIIAIVAAVVLALISWLAIILAG